MTGLGRGVIAPAYLAVALLYPMQADGEVAQSTRMGVLNDQILCYTI